MILSSDCRFTYIAHSSEFKHISRHGLGLLHLSTEMYILYNATGQSIWININSCVQLKRKGMWCETVELSLEKDEGWHTFAYVTIGKVPFYSTQMINYSISFVRCVSYVCRYHVQNGNLFIQHFFWSYCHNHKFWWLYLRTVRIEFNKNKFQKHFTYFMTDIHLQRWIRRFIYKFGIRKSVRK